MITAEQDAPTIRSDLWLRAPLGFFTQNFSHVVGGVHGHRPDIAGSIGYLSIRHEQKSLTIGRPGRIDDVINGRVIVAIDLTRVLLDQTLRPTQVIVSNLCQIAIEMTTVGSGNKGHPASIW